MNRVFEIYWKKALEVQLNQERVVSAVLNSFIKKSLES